VLGAPLLGEVAAEGGGEDGLAELLEQGGDGVERVARAPAALLQGLELGDDAALLPEGGKGDLHRGETPRSEMRDVRRDLGNALEVASTHPMPEETQRE
jgi:hypothetical protein